jgi:hypothetical protein
VFSFISQFWASIVDTIVGGVTYPASWFQQIGLAVAGAIGGFFLSIGQYLFDIIASVGYIFHAMWLIVPMLFSPIYFIADFFTNAVPSISDFNNSTSTISGLATSTTAYFNQILGSSAPFGSIFALIWALTLFALTFRLFKSFKKL